MTFFFTFFFCYKKKSLSSVMFPSIYRIYKYHKKYCLLILTNFAIVLAIFSVSADKDFSYFIIASKREFSLHYFKKISNKSSSVSY